MIMGIRYVFQSVANNGEWDIGVSVLVGVWLFKKYVAWMFA